MNRQRSFEARSVLGIGRCFLAVLLACGVALAPAAPAAHAGPMPVELTPPPSPEETSAEQEFLVRLNEDRTAAGLAPLTPDPQLMAWARWRSEDMASREYFAHDIDGYNIFAVMHSPAYVRASENLAFNNLDAARTVRRAESDLMASQGHREAILDGGYDRVGVGVAAGKGGRTYFTQLFVQSPEAPASAAAGYAARG